MALGQRHLADQENDFGELGAVFVLSLFDYNERSIMMYSIMHVAYACLHTDVILTDSHFTHWSLVDF